MTKHKQKKNLAFPVLLLIGTAVSGATLLLTSFIGALIANSCDNPTSLVNILSIAATLISGAVCGFLISKFKGDGGIAIATLTSLFFALILMLIGLVAAKGHISVGSIINYLCYIGTSTIFASLGQQRRIRHKRR